MTELTISAGGVHLAGDLAIPSDASGLIVFVHGGGRFNARNRVIAEELQRRGFATLLFDLLTPEEAAVSRRGREMRFDVDRFARRVVFVTDWLRQYPGTADFEIGYFGAAAGAAAALIAAAHHPDRVKAVVARGGRPDLAMEVLPKVRAATLLIVAEDDPVTVQLNRNALAYLQCEKRFDTVADIDAIAEPVARWFGEHVTAGSCAKVAGH